MAHAREAREAVLASLEDAARDQRVVEAEYFSASRGVEGRRSLSIHRILHSGHVRVLATCHRTGALKFFRADRFRNVRARPAETFRPALEDEVESFLSTSLDWFRTSADAALCRFTVRLPEARWVRSNLPSAPFVDEPVPGGMRFEVRTTGVEPLARFVVGLGGAARAETRELQQAVAALALGALAQAGAKSKRKLRSGRPKRSTE
jgi:predicted DNA-binding transcriptional regulator YafY